MIAPEKIYKNQLIRDIWGDRCIDCESTSPPKVDQYFLKNEEVMVLSCSKCDFTIVVVEVDRLANNSYNDLSDENDTLLITAKNKI